MDGLLLSTTALRRLSASAQQEVLASIGLGGIEMRAVADMTVSAATPVSPTTSDGSEGPVELTVAMVRKLTDKLGEKTLNTLKIIASSDSLQFHLRDVIAGTTGAKDYMDMRGVWSALTRRTRKIMDDDDVDLIWWLGEGIYDEDDNYVDHIGSIAPLTYKSLRTHFDF